jgi:hypothetical protein
MIWCAVAGVSQVCNLVTPVMTTTSSLTVCVCLTWLLRLPNPASPQTSSPPQTTGALPAAWRGLDAAHLLSSLSAFDPVDCGYLDWRELAIALIAASYPELTKSTAADMAGLTTQAVAAAAGLSPAPGGGGRASSAGAADAAAAGGQQQAARGGSAGGAGPLLQRASYQQLRWWFDPKEPLEAGDAAAEQLAAAAARWGGAAACGRHVSNTNDIH